MSRPDRNPRRAYDSQGRPLPPMTLGNLRTAMRCRTVAAECANCLHDAEVNVDALPDQVPVPDVALRLRCSACGSKRITSRPNMSEYYRTADGIARL